MADLIPYLAAHDASAAITFYVRAFGATETSRWTDPETGKIGHAELTVCGRRLFVSDEWPEGGVRAPQDGAGTSVSLVLDVSGTEDVDTVFARATDLGARVQRPLTEDHGDRSGWVIDPFGHRWCISATVEELTREELQDRVGPAYDITQYGDQPSPRS